ncbi:MAG: response regulator [candidate division KSB1 bacterium]|nr:response regulator [candidate division KSB1 bacterium]
MDHNEIKILLVDDEEDSRLLIREAIEEARVSNGVYEVGSGEEALDFLYRRGKYTNAPRPGLIYLDIQMPGMSGQEVLKQIKSNEDFKDIAVVMMTGLDDSEEKKLAAQNGANSYTVKPSNPEEFLRTVIEATNYWLKIHRYPNS